MSQLQPTPNNGTEQPALSVLGEELASQYAVDSIELESDDDTPSQAAAFKVPSDKLLGTFHNSTSTKVLQHEKPWHRYALHLMARAKMSCSDVAKTLQVSVSSVQTLVKQPWFQEQYTALVSARADSMYEQLLEGEDVNSLLVLVEIRDDTRQKAATRAAVAFDILDRMKGKAVQRTLSISSSIKHTSDIDKMKEELADLERQEQEMMGATQKQPNANGVVK